MTRVVSNIFRLGIKELFSLRYDPVMLFLIAYMFSFSVFEVAQNQAGGVTNAAVAIVDEDRSQLSFRIGDALLPPHFQRPKLLAIDDIGAAMDAGRYTFVIDIPPGLQADLVAGRPAVIQLNVDATAMTIAGNGAGYIQRIIEQEASAVTGRDRAAAQAVELVARSRFNPNLEGAWFASVMEITNNITLLAILLTGAALIREREHGTIEHLLVMPLRPVEIMLAKIWANGLVVLCAVSLSLYLIVKGALSVPIIGSVPLYLSGVVIYLFSVTSLGILMATLARSMPQFGLLTILVFVLMLLLSGGHTPLESMPDGLQTIMQLAPSTHFVSMAQAILFRGAGLDVVWPQFLTAAVIGAAFFLAALLRFRKTVSVLA